MKKITILILFFPFLFSCTEDKIKIPEYSHLKILGLEGNVKTVEVNFFLNEIVEQGYIPKKKVKIKTTPLDFTFNQFRSEFSLYNSYCESFDPFTTPLYFLARNNTAFFDTYSYKITFNKIGNVTKLEQFNKKQDSIINSIDITYNDKNLPVKIKTRRLSGTVSFIAGEADTKKTIKDIKYINDEFTYSYNKYNLIETVKINTSNTNETNKKTINYKYDFKKDERVLFVYRENDRNKFATIDLDNEYYISKITIKNNRNILNEKYEVDFIQNFIKGIPNEFQKFDKDGQLLKKNIVKYNPKTFQIESFSKIEWRSSFPFINKELKPFKSSCSFIYNSSKKEKTHQINHIRYDNPNNILGKVGTSKLASLYNEMKSSTAFHYTYGDTYKNNWTELNYEVDRKYLDDYMKVKETYFKTFCIGGNLYDLKSYNKNNPKFNQWYFQLLKILKAESNQTKIVRNIRYYN